MTAHIDVLLFVLIGGLGLEFLRIFF